MWERVRFILSGIGDFLWPLIKQFLIASAPIVKLAAMTAVQCVAQKYVGTTISNNDKHSDAYSMIVDELTKQGLKLGIDFTESMIDTAIAAAVKNMKGA